MLALPSYLNIVRASAAYDLLLTAPFATPWTFALTHRWLSTLNQALGGAPLPPFEPLHTLFACLLGSSVVAWSLLRLAGPALRLGRADAGGRILYALWMGWALAHGDAPILWWYLVPELALAVALFLPVIDIPTVSMGPGVLRDNYRGARKNRLF
jgi:hypothetical protein